MTMQSKQLRLALAALALWGCADEGPTDRTKEPVAALNAARAALHRQDLRAYFDALSDEAVRETLSNSIGICLASNTPEMLKTGRPPSKGCEGILAAHGWRQLKESEPAALRKAWCQSLLRVADPRRMAYELEKNHRVHDTGSSFVWNYLDPVKVLSVDVRGTKATAKVKWGGDEKAIEFERDATGWRLTPHPDARELRQC